MKKLLLALLITAASGKISAQNEYFQHNPEWTVMEMWSMTYPCVAYDTVTFYLNGDTLINSLTYKKLHSRGTCRNTWFSPNPNMSCSLTPYNYPYTGYMGAIRSAGTQIFYIPENQSQEGMLYDYNLQLGDTVPYCAMTTPDPNVTIVSIDSTYTPYGYLKRFYLSSDPNQFIMEGAMSSYGLYHYCGVMMDFASYSMCYTLNDTAWWPAQGPNCDAILLSTSNVPNQNISVQLVPNPASEYMEVIASGFSVESITVYDVFGRAVKQEQESTKIAVGDLPSGVYTCVITAGQMRINRLLIVE